MSHSSSATGVSPLHLTDTVELQELSFPNSNQGNSDMPLVRADTQEHILEDISSDKPQGEPFFVPCMGVDPIQRHPHLIIANRISGLHLLHFPFLLVNSVLINLISLETEAP